MRRLKPREAQILAAVLVVIFVSLVLLWANGKITAWVDGEKFRAMIDQETSKGLKLEGHYAPLTRVGWLGMRCDSFLGTKGAKTIVSIDAHQISGMFNPLGIALQRWELDNLHIHSGTVMLQKTEATPGAKPPSKPWWGWFWPYRVHLSDVKVDDADILWQLKEKESGIYHTFLEITPNGHDFEYDARGGEFKTPLTPTLQVQHVHMLIRRPKLTCTELLLGDDTAHPEEQLRAHGEAGLQDDRSIKLLVDFTSLKVPPWLPEKLQTHVLGQASGHFEYASSGTGLETGEGHGHMAIANGVLHELAAVRRYVVLTGSPDPGDLVLKVCEADLTWKQGGVSAENLNVECEGVFRLEGTLGMDRDKNLSGNLQLGLTDPYLRWLPNARQDIFSRDEGDYHFATIHFSGTVEKPAEDLSGRVTRLVEKSPKTELKLFFNEAGSWFDFK
jgi:hypothetical protein